MWRIWYSDGSTISGTTEAEWNAAPDSGVQVAQLYLGEDKYGRKLFEVANGVDWYWLDQGHLKNNGSSTWEKNSWTEHSASKTATMPKKGEWLPDKRYAEITAAALQWRLRAKT